MTTLSSKFRSKLQSCKPFAPVISMGSRNSSPGRGGERLARGSKRELGMLVVGGPGEITGPAPAQGGATSARNPVARATSNARLAMIRPPPQSARLPRAHANQPSFTPANAPAAHKHHAYPKQQPSVLQTLGPMPKESHRLLCKVS